MTSGIMASPAGREGGRGSCRDKVRKRGQEADFQPPESGRCVKPVTDNKEKETCGRPERLKRTSKAVKSARRF